MPRQKEKVYGQYCPVARSLDVVGDRWTLLIVRDLLRGTQRFKDLQASLSGIAPNLLSDRLKKLEGAGLVARTLFKQIPPKVEYALTEKGKALDSVLSSLAEFGMLNLMDRPSKGDSINPELIFQAMPSVFKPAAAKDVRAVYRVDITGKQGGTWYVSISNRACRVSKEPVPSDVVISTDAKSWALLATGALEPDEAERKGKLSITGHRELAERFVTFFHRGSATEIRSHQRQKAASLEK